MTDIVERLRNSREISHWPMIGEAANEIERLRAALDLIATGRPASAGTAPLSFERWARLIASAARYPTAKQETR